MAELDFDQIAADHHRDGYVSGVGLLSEHSLPFCSEYEPVYGLQFHPEEKLYIETVGTG